MKDGVETAFCALVTLLLLRDEFQEKKKREMDSLM